MKNPNKIFFVALLLIAVCLSFGYSKRKSVVSIEREDRLRIEKVGNKTGRVKIDDIPHKRGDKFIAKQRIALFGNEYIVVTNMRTGARQTLHSSELKSSNTSSFYTFIRKKYAAGKGQSDFKALLERYPWPMIEDTIRIPTSMRLDDDHGFVLKTIPDYRELSPVPFDPETNELVLTKEYFQENDMQLEDGINYTFFVIYWDLPDYQTLTDSFVIQYIYPIQ